jgi:uridine kinase
VIVEGVYALRPQLRDFYDITIFVDTPRDYRLRRMLDRNADEAERIVRWMAAEDWYLDNEDPRSHANVVLSGV